MSAHLETRSFDEFLRYRQQEALAGAVSFCTVAAAQRAVNPCATIPRILAALLGGSDRRFVYAREEYAEASFWDGGFFVTVDLDPGHAWISVFAQDGGAREHLDAVLARIDAFGPAPRESGGVWVRFATHADDHVSLRTRFMPCPTLESLRGNYAAGVQAALDRLAADPAPWELGKLVIWSGPAGTGKTHALRALLLAWQARFDCVVVNDPERFAATPSYYQDVLSCSGVDSGAPEGYTKAMEQERQDRPKLFIFEDAADLILLDSRSDRPDAMGKFLNLTDGLFGQGRRDLFLVTFNEAIEEIDPAFLRPGRCRAVLHFPALSRGESEAWLERHGLPAEAGEDLTLADLYRRLNVSKRGPGGEDPAEGPGAGAADPERIGFFMRQAHDHGHGTGTL